VQGLVLLAASPALADTRVVIPEHDIARGAIIEKSDLSLGSIPSGTVFSGMFTTTEALAGLQARRLLRAGEAVRHDDVRQPILVSKGSIVTSFRQLSATVSGAGAVRAGGALP
jgi:flagella basal body P-ring formation protein FlgA